MKRIEIDMPKGIHQRTFQALEKTTEGLSNHWKVGLAVIALSLFSLVSTLGDTNAPPTNTPPVNTQSTNAPPSGSGIPAPGHTEAWVNLIEKHLFTVTGGVLLAVGLFLVLVGAIGMIPPIAKVVEKTKLGKSAPKRCIIVGSVLVIFGILFLVLQPFWSQVNTTGPTGSLTLFVLCIMSGITFLAGYLLHNRLRILVQHEEHLVGVVEDATRRVLKGFPEIFDRSLWLLDRALEEKREVWFVNCALNFGRVHAENPLIGKQYHELTKRQKVFFTKKTDPNSGAETEDGAVEEFRRKLSSMVEQMPILRILSITGETTKPDGTKSDATQAFLKSVTKPRGYETVKGHEAFDKMLTLISGWR